MKIKLVGPRWMAFPLWVLAALSSSAQTTPPYASDFESTAGYTLGSLAAQDGWSVPGGSASVTGDEAFSGTFSVGLLPNSGNTVISHTFAQLTGAVITYIDFYARPTVADSLSATTKITAEGSEIGLIRLDSTGHILAFDGDGNGGGRWVVTGRTVALNGSGQALGWTRFTIRQDYSAKKWDLYLDGQIVLQDMGLRDNTKSYLSQFSLASASSSTAYFDYFYVGPVNPLFTDQDNDGMEDAWELAHGLDPAVDDRNSDPDGDGLTNIEEYALGANPSQADSDADGLPDGWEVQHGSNPLVDDAASDPGGGGEATSWGDPRMDAPIRAIRMSEAAGLYWQRVCLLRGPRI